MNQVLLFTGQAHPALAQELAACPGIRLGQVEIVRFPDGELGVEVKEEVRGAQVFVLQPTCSSEAIVELLLLADALKRCQPRRLVLIVPYFGYGRQERRVGQSPVSAEVLARLLSQGGADAVVTVELHSQAIGRFFTLLHQELYVDHLFADQIRRQIPAGERLVVVSPDRGGCCRAERLNQALNTGRPVVVLEKRRLSPERCQLEGPGPAVDVRGVRAILVDDIVATGSTLIQGARWLEERGAGPIWACVTHLVAAPDELSRRLAGTPLERILVTDSLPNPEPPAGSRLQIISLAPLLASAVVQRSLWVRAEGWVRSLRRRPVAEATWTPGGLPAIH